KRLILSDEPTLMNTDSKNFSNSASKEDNDEIDLMALLFAILRGWKIIVSFAVLGLILGILYSRYVNPTIRSDALIQIDEQSKGISALGSDISELIGSEESKAQTEAELIRSRMILEPVVNLLHLRIRLSDPTIGYLDRIKSNVTSTQINTPEGVAIETENGQAYISQFNVSQAYLDKSFTLTRSATGLILSNGFDEFKGQFNQPDQFSGSNGQIQITVADLPDNAHPISITNQSLQNTTNAINSALTVTEKGKQTGIIHLSMTGLRQQQVTLVLSHIVLSYIDQNQSRGSQETTKTIQFMETQIPTLKKKLEDSERT